MTRKLRLTYGAVSVWLGLTASALSLGCQGPSISVLDLGSGTPIDLNGAAQESYFRLGHFLIGAPSFDICVKGPSDADFRGPLLRQQTARPGGVPYDNVSTYLTVATTGYSVRAVPGANTDCKTSLGGLMDLPLSALAQGRHYTFAASGILSGATVSTIKFNLIEDDLNIQAGQARVRFINAASEVPSAELGLGAGAQYMAKLTGAAYGNVGYSGMQVYLAMAALTNAAVTVRASGGSTDTLAIPSKVNAPADMVTTMVFSGSSDKSYFSPLSLVVCNDSATAVSGLASCTELP